MRNWHRWSSAPYFYQVTTLILPWLYGVAAVAGGFGLWGALVYAPADFQQGDAFRIIYVHVPCAILSLALYAAMALCSIIYLVWHLKLADRLARALVSVGMLFCGLALLTGSIWGRPMWGTWWVWDARLTSELVLLFLYWGNIALRHVIVSDDQAAKACAVVGLMGAVDLPVIHYSVTWWQTLHQGPTLLTFGPQHISGEMLWPLLCMLFASGAMACILVVLSVHYDLLNKYSHTQWVKLLCDDTPVLKKVE